ncbi:MAG: cupin domain-containing protein [Rubrobacter sp.]|nr:cupin domain-containing protein [Rubrobacter sp.]
MSGRFLEASAPHTAKSSTASEGIVEWGAVPEKIGGGSHTSGFLIHKGEDGSEAGIWICTPGEWRCHVERDEFCHFLEGRCTYTHESGDIIEVEADTTAFFPAGWKGTCRVHETVRKAYMIR